MTATRDCPHGYLYSKRPHLCQACMGDEIGRLRAALYRISLTGDIHVEPGQVCRACGGRGGHTLKCPVVMAHDALGDA